MLDLLAPYRLLIGAALVAVAMGGAYLKGRGDGADSANVRCQAAQIDAQRARERERADLQAALDARAAELARRQQEAANAVEKVRVEYLPAKTIVRREVVERAVFRECRIGGGLRDTLNAALRGRPATGEAAGDRAGVVPG